MLTTTELDRRSFLSVSAKGAVLALGASTMPSVLSACASLDTAAPAPALAGAGGAYTLPPLGYGFDALAPAVDAQTMEIHHDRHHAGYVKNVNAALAGVAGVPADIWELCAKINQVAPADKRTAVRNNGGGHANHSLFWQVLAPKGQGGAPSAALSTAITRDLGGMGGFKEAFSKAAATQFGSGWAWLVQTPSGKLAITSTPNQDNPVMADAPVKGKPLLNLDVWEHAYYLHYQNRRADYIAAFFDIINWNTVNARFAQG